MFWNKDAESQLLLQTKPLASISRIGFFRCLVRLPGVDGQYVITLYTMLCTYLSKIVRVAIYKYILSSVLE